MEWEEKQKYCTIHFYSKFASQDQSCGSAQNSSYHKTQKEKRTRFGERY